MKKEKNKTKKEVKQTKINILIIFVIILGVTTLFFFPEPATNFFGYVGTGLFFIVLIIILFIIKRNKKL